MFHMFCIPDLYIYMYILIMHHVIFHYQENVCWFFKFFRGAVSHLKQFIIFCMIVRIVHPYIMIWMDLFAHC